MKKLNLLALVIMGAFASSAFAQVTVSDAWVRGTVQGQKVTGAFMRLSSAEDTAVVGVESPVAGVVEIHETRKEGDVMRMRPVGKLDVPAGKTVELKPGGYHIMLMDLKQPLKAGEFVPIKLKVKRKDNTQSTVELKVEVRDLTGSSGAGHKH